MATSLYFDFNLWLATGALGFARIAPIFFMLPFLNGNVLTAFISHVVAIVVAMALWPHSLPASVGFDGLPYIGMLAGELAIGVLLGCLLSFPFWALHAVGCFIDNQRGATLSSSIDPVNGVETSEQAKFFNYFAAAVYLQQGGMKMMLQVISDSYRICDPIVGCDMRLQPLTGLLTNFMTQVIIFSSPVIAALLISEITLGLLSRFAPQLNAFSISMTIKSLIAFLILLLYFGAIAPVQVMSMAFKVPALIEWLRQ